MAVVETDSRCPECHMMMVDGAIHHLSGCSHKLRNLEAGYKTRHKLERRNRFKHVPSTFAMWVNDDPERQFFFWFFIPILILILAYIFFAL